MHTEAEPGLIQRPKQIGYAKCSIGPGAFQVYSWVRKQQGKKQQQKNLPESPDKRFQVKAVY